MYIYFIIIIIIIVIIIIIITITTITIITVYLSCNRPEVPVDNIHMYWRHLATAKQTT